MSAKLSSLQPFKAPPPVEKEACAACEAFAPECLVPVGDAAVPMCWLCAHHVVEHNVAPHRACAAKCKCAPSEIYPHRAPLVIEVVEKAPEHTPRERDRAKLLAAPPAKLAVWAREAHKQMSDTQLAAVKRRLS